MITKHWRGLLLAIAFLATFVSARGSCGGARCDPSLAAANMFEDVFWATAFPHHFPHGRHSKNHQQHRYQRHLGQKRNYHEVLGGADTYTYIVHDDNDSITLNMVLPGYSSSMIDLELKTETQFGDVQRSLMVSPKNTKTATPSPFTPTVFIIDSKIDSNTITSTMKNGILEIVGKKVKPMVDKMTLPIIEEVSIEDEAGKEEKEAEEVLEDPSPNDSVDVEIKIDEE